MEAAPRFTPDPGRRPRRANLTPMVDVLFLLVVFFLLAARFEAQGALPLAAGGAGGADDGADDGAAWEGPPRLVTVTPLGVALNGVPVAGDLPAALAPLMPAPDAPVVLRAAGGASLQRLIEVIEALRAAGYRTLLLAE